MVDLTGCSAIICSADDWAQWQYQYRLIPEQHGSPLMGDWLMDSSMALSILPENSTAVWGSFYSISFLPSFHTSLKVLLTCVSQASPFTGISLNKSRIHIIPCLLLGGHVLAQSWSITCLNIVRFGVLTFCLNFPMYFHEGNKLIVFSPHAVFAWF